MGASFHHISVQPQDNCSQEIEKIKTNYWSQVKELNATIDDLVSTIISLISYTFIVVCSEQKAQVDETKKKYDRHKTQVKQEKEVCVDLCVHAVILPYATV